MGLKRARKIQCMYSCDWFSSQIPHVTKTLKDQTVERILEIGSFEGRSAVWFLESYPNAQMVCVDTFQGSPEHVEANMDVSSLYERFSHNTQAHRDRLTVKMGHSSKMLYGMEPESFDLIYVDGSHTEADTLMDLILSMGLLKSGGTLLVDDYNQPSFPGVRAAVDTLVRVYDFETVYNAYQIHLRKK
jgi:predicted O-methyltransferase YrrM